MVVSVASSSLVASFAISSATSFHSTPMCPGTHDTSIIARLFSSRKVLAASTGFCDICWLDPGISFVIALTNAVLSVNCTILDHLLFASGTSCWNSIAVSKPSAAPTSRHRKPQQTGQEQLLSRRVHKSKHLIVRVTYIPILAR